MNIDSVTISLSHITFHFIDPPTTHYPIPFLLWPYLFLLLIPITSSSFLWQIDKRQKNQKALGNCNDPLSLSNDNVTTLPNRLFPTVQHCQRISARLSVHRRESHAVLPAEREEAALLPSISPSELSLGLSCNGCSSINQLSSWNSPTSSFQFQVCEHCSYRNAKEYQWQNKTIILAADYASNGIYNFIIPLRAHFRSKTSLNPIILLLERRPDVAFLDAISYFPLVRVIKGLVLDTHTQILIHR